MPIYSVQGEVGGSINIKAETFGEAERKFRQCTVDSRRKSMKILSIIILVDYYRE